ncbi:MAG: FAD-dependent oxidoreductase [Candidatus Thermoplasmatota archaeon]
MGCGAGGATAAQFARKTDRKANITILEKDSYPQYSKCGLPYAISGEIPSFKDLIEFSEEWFKKSRIDLKLKTEVKQIDYSNRVVKAENEEESFEKNFDSLIIATGAQPFIPPIENIKPEGNLVDGVFPVRTIDDAKNIAAYMENTKKVTVVGAGLIGLEMADCLYKKEMDVTIVEALPDILPNYLEKDMSSYVYKKIPDDIKIFTNSIVSKVETEDDKLSHIILEDKDEDVDKKIETEIMVIATGNKPNTYLAEKIGCKVGDTGGIKVNSKSETSLEDVYAVGDCTEYQDFITQKPILVGLGSIAVRQGIAAGVNAAGGKYQLPSGALQTSTSEFFNVEISSVGSSPKSLEENNVTAKFSGSSLPEYFPGGKPVNIKIKVDEETETISSAQIVGKNAALRVNTYACAVLNQTKIDKFRKMETAYAPPIAPTLDPLTLVCDIANMKLKRKKRRKT